MNKVWLGQLERVQPSKICKVRGVSFFIYKAKDLHNPKWNSGVLKQITREARKSFLRYGRMALINRYDKKAEIYLCRAVDNTTEEWLCLRFIPGQAGEVMLEDLQQYVCNGRPVSDVMADTLGRGFQARLVSISRLCGIAPYYRIPRDEAQSPSHMKYVGMSFALINKLFFSQHKFSYLIGSFRKELLEKVLRVSSRVQLQLPDAQKIIGRVGQQIRLQRNFLVYNFPGYFLNVGELIGLLDKLIREDVLNLKAIRFFIKGYKKNFTKYLKGKKYFEILRHTWGLNRLLRVSGIIPGTNLTGSQLRSLAMQQVDDGPVLKMVAVSQWKKQLDKIKL